MSEQILRTPRVRPLRRLATAAGLCALVLQAGAAPASVASGRPHGAPTLEALVERLNAARAKGFKEGLVEMMPYVAPGDRKLVAGPFLLLAAMRGMEVREEGEKAELQKWQKKYEATMRKHGLEEMLDLVEVEGEVGPKGLLPLLTADEAAKTELLHALVKDTDEIALVEDLGVLLADQQAVFEPRPPLRITRVESDRAVAQGGEETVSLERIDGRWYMRWSW